ncbi:hypothetical protein ANN_12765 [Periplaneta americana]|uniref:DUF4817 domain-containing protein n=1 Tax=Periplaneta americana TaxID=6978 RepID=A0ABQ8TJN2_PERAM|nr:hypothetical protein ANN_12765 [Periplaneta americana]
MAGLCEGGNEPPGSLKANNVDEIGDSEMVFGEMRPRFRHRLPGNCLTVGENLGRNQTRTHFDIGCHARIPTRNTILRWVASFRITGSTLKKKSNGRNSIALRLSEATVRSRALRLLSLGPFEGAEEYNKDAIYNLPYSTGVPGESPLQRVCPSRPIVRSGSYVTGSSKRGKSRDT